MPYKFEITADNPLDLEQMMIHAGQMAGAIVQLRGLAQRQQRANAERQVGEMADETKAADADVPGALASSEPETAIKPKPRGRPAKPRVIVDTGSGGVPMPPEPLDPKLADPLDPPDFLKREKPKAEAADVPKDIDGLRAMLNKLVEAKGAAAATKIINGDLGVPILSKVPLEDYPKAVKLIQEAMAA